MEAAASLLPCKGKEVMIACRYWGTAMAILGGGNGWGLFVDWMAVALSGGQLLRTEEPVQGRDTHQIQRPWSPGGSVSAWH